MCSATCSQNDPRKDSYGSGVGGPMREPMTMGLIKYYCPFVLHFVVV